MTKYVIINLHTDSATVFSFDRLVYHVSPDEAKSLIKNGVLFSEDDLTSFVGTVGCHQCRHTFYIPITAVGSPDERIIILCPYCGSRRWDTYTLFYCNQCHALFEEVEDSLAKDHPYNYFPTCPVCKREHWCPAAEEARAQAEEAQAKRQTEEQAYTNYMQFLKQQKMKKLGLSSNSRMQPLGAENHSGQSGKIEQEKGAAMTEAEALYKSKEGKSTWINKKEPPNKGK